MNTQKITPDSKLCRGSLNKTPIDNKSLALEYQGVPRLSSKSERTRWQRFWTAVRPWSNTKYDQIERRLEAEVAFKEAEVAVKKAEAKKLLAEAESYHADANLKNAQALEIEKEILDGFSCIKITEQVKEQFRTQLEQEMKMLFLLKGTRIIAKLEDKKRDST